MILKEASSSFNKALVTDCRLVSKISWGECIRTEAFLHNKTPSSAISNMTLDDTLHKKVPDQM